MIADTMDVRWNDVFRRSKLSPVVFVVAPDYSGRVDQVLEDLGLPNPTAGSITPEWSRWITYAVNDRSQLVRSLEGGASRIIAQSVDAFDVQARPDSTLLVTLITAKRDPSNPGWRRYANSITVHPKN